MNGSPLKGKVARILDTRSLVINIGSQQGVKIDMYFDVMDPKGDDIRDPDTNKILGSLERPKVRVQIIEVKDNISVASTYKKEEINIGGRGLGIHLAFAEYLMPAKWVTKYETLKTTEKTWKDLSEKESYVKTGDPVKEVRSEVVEIEQAIEQQEAGLET